MEDQPGLLDSVVLADAALALELVYFPVMDMATPVPAMAIQVGAIVIATPVLDIAIPLPVLRL
jgi:hypothetical protein